MEQTSLSKVKGLNNASGPHQVLALSRLGVGGPEKMAWRRRKFDPSKIREASK